MYIIYNIQRAGRKISIYGRVYRDFNSWKLPAMVTVQYLVE